MNVATGCFTAVDKTEEAVKALRDAKFPDDHIGIFTRDNTKGMQLAKDLGRDFRSGETPPSDRVISDRMIYDRLPDEYVNTVDRSNLGDDAVTWYRAQLDKGAVLVVVDVGDRMADADCTLTAHGAQLYPGSPGRECPPEQQAQPRERMAATGQAPPTRTEGEVRLPIVDEEVMVEKTQHQVGEVRVTAERSSETVEVPATVMHEELRVERRRLDHPLRPDEYKGATTTEEGVFRMPIVEEEVRVTKQPIIREELVITRLPVSEKKTVRETITHTEPHVETTGDVEIHRERVEGEEKRRPAA